MFSNRPTYSIQALTVPTLSGAHVNKDQLNYYYDCFNEFSASLFILYNANTTPKESKEAQKANDFISLTFCFCDKSSNSRQVTSFSIYKANDKFNISVLSGDKACSFHGPADDMMTKIAESANAIQELMKKAHEQLDTSEMITDGSKRLLGHMNKLAKRTIELTTPGEDAKPAMTFCLEGIVNLLKLEIAEYTNVINLNSSPSLSHRR